MKTTFLLEAKEELSESVAYYESQGTGLGLKFLHQIELAVELIKQYPHSGSAMGSSGLQRMLVNKFPFGILYHIQNNHSYTLKSEKV